MSRNVTSLIILKFHAGKDDTNESPVEAKFYIKISNSEMKVYKEYLIYDAIGMLSTVGGTLGLFVGFSVNNIFKFAIRNLQNIVFRSISKWNILWRIRMCQFHVKNEKRKNIREMGTHNTKIFSTHWPNSTPFHINYKITQKFRKNKIDKRRKPNNYNCDAKNLHF